MAFVGMKHVVAAPIKTEVAGQAVTYDTGVEIGAAISATVTINRNTEGLYANDALKESDNSITGGTIDLNIDDISDDAAEKILGVKKTAGESQNPTVFHETGEAAPYVGLGYYRVRRLNGVELSGVLVSQDPAFHGQRNGQHQGGEHHVADSYHQRQHHGRGQRFHRQKQVPGLRRLYGGV